MNAPQYKQPKAASQPDALTLRSEQAFTTIEAVFAAGIVALFLSGIFLMNSNVGSMLRLQKEQGASSLCAQERMEQLRGLNFTNLISPAYLINSVFNNATVASTNLRLNSETLTLSQYTPTGSGTITILRSGTTVSSSTVGGGIPTSQKLVRADLTYQWKSLSNNTVSRQVSAVIANGGINSNNP